MSHTTSALTARHERLLLRYDLDDYRRFALRRLTHRYIKGPRVLDLRCLAGYFPLELMRRGFEVTAVDFSPYAVEVANACGRENDFEKDIAEHCLTADVERLGSERFDTVVCLDVLHHAPDDMAAIRASASTLKPGGRYIVCAPAFPAILGSRDRGLDHYRRYGRRELVRLLERNELRIEVHRYWNFLLFPFYILIDKVLRADQTDDLRHTYRRTRLGKFANSALRQWFVLVENNVRAPFGLSHFMIARKNKGSAR